MSLDLRLVSTDLPYPLSWVSGDEATLQRLQVKLGIWRGEPLFDSEAGVPWYQWLGFDQRRPPIGTICAVVQQLVVETPGVRSAEVTGAVVGTTIRLTIRTQLGNSTAVVEVGPPTTRLANEGGVWWRLVTHSFR